ncbi:PREDICTED: CASP-like protein 1D1 [Erythranthe guttata]|uniref:CASP-like protein 1D1 n=1 Tax=Erythranthe guttata TaxID=4155 RepID=UPI00064E0DE5|nr:PREDICTED: CASP-like protein 1D1 [Erythranthe guttata]|eukprot:XP_012841724.1 PREDICTED: CASP-like protein 1D1 [Erythranthe guttata]
MSADSVVSFEGPAEAEVAPPPPPPPPPPPAPPFPDVNNAAGIAIYSCLYMNLQTFISAVNGAFTASQQFVGPNAAAQIEGYLTVMFHEIGGNWNVAVNRDPFGMPDPTGDNVISYHVNGYDILIYRSFDFPNIGEINNLW